MRFVTNQTNITEEQAIAKLLESRPYIALDIETVSLDNPLILGIAVALSDTIGYYFFNPRDSVLKKVIEESPLVLFHNASFDVPALAKLGIQVPHWEDTMLLAYSAGLLHKGLEDLSRDFLHRPYTKVTSQWKKTDQGNIAIDHVKMAGWSLQHAMNTLLLWERLPHTQLYKDIDRPAIDLVMEMEGWGLLIDQYRLTLVEQETMTKVLKLEAELKIDLNSPDINLGSNPQVSVALQAQGIIGTRKTKGFKDSVSDESLKPLHNPIADKILKFRSLMKTVSTYIPALRNLVDGQGRLHTHYGYAATGRWTSSDPNLQNLSKDDKFGDE